MGQGGVGEGQSWKPSEIKLGLWGISQSLPCNYKKESYSTEGVNNANIIAFASQTTKTAFFSILFLE